MSKGTQSSFYWFDWEIELAVFKLSFRTRMELGNNFALSISRVFQKLSLPLSATDRRTTVYELQYMSLELEILAFLPATS